jgi:hypothetical protein
MADIERRIHRQEAPPQNVTPQQPALPEKVQLPTKLDKRNQLERTMDEIGVPEEERPILRAVARLPQKPPVQLRDGFKEELLAKTLAIPLVPREQKNMEATERKFPPAPQRDIPPQGK